MKLTLEELKNNDEWKKSEVALPLYNPEVIAQNTKKNPIWVHFGAGNIFRGYIAGLQDTLLNMQESNCGIQVIETFDYEIIDKIYQPHDNLTLRVTLKSDGTTESRVVASIVEGIKGDFKDEQALEHIKELFVSPTLQIISFTITEKGYELRDSNGDYLFPVKQDLENGPRQPMHVMAILTALLYERYKAGKLPVAVVSMDNCSHNGEKLQDAVTSIAKEWITRLFIEAEFIEYLTDGNLVSFPWSMIDKITPRPARLVKEKLIQQGIEQMETVITSRNTYIAPFVNAESTEYLVIEDKFPNGRPPLEKAGVYLTDQDTVNKVERMKVTTCLNPLHTALAIYGCLLGYNSISEEMKDPQLLKLIKGIGYEEGMKVVTDPVIISPEKFIDEVISERLPNPFIPDTPQRIATDTSQKMRIRFGETIKAYNNHKALSVEDLNYIPLVIAGWLRYLLGVDDNLNEMQLSPDPMLLELTEKIKGIAKNPEEKYQIQEILSNKSIFGVDLCQIGLAKKIEDIFFMQIKEKGAVRNSLINVLEKL